MTGRPGPVDTTLPPGFRIVLDRRVRVLDGGAVLIGGAPPRLVRLAPAAQRLLRGGELVVAGAASAMLVRRLVDGGLAHPAPACAPEVDTSVAGSPAENAHVDLGRVDSDLPGDGAASPACLPTPTRGHAERDSRAHGVRLAGTRSATRGYAAGDVTVVVPVRDRPDGLRRLLTALTPPTPLAGSPGSRLGGIVVVDDGSADPSAIRAVAQQAGAHVVRHDVSRGPAAARNAGAAAATTPLLAFLDSDVVPEPGWLPPLLAHFADPAVALAAPRIVALGPVTGLLGRYEAVRSSLDLGPDPAPVVPRSRVAYVPSAALVVRRDALAGAAFDERMHVAEDVDLVLRLHAAGWRLRYEPASRVAHDHRTSPTAWWLRKAYYGTGAAPLALRHAGAVPPLVLSPWSAAVGALLLLRRPVAAAAVTALAAARLARRLDGRVDRPRATAALLVGLGTVGVLAQTAQAVTRHFWPVAALACLASPRARRTVATVALAEGVVDWWRHRDRHPGVRPSLPAHLAAHRLDDLGYGAGLWWGAIRHRTSAPLRPAWTGSVSAPARPRASGRVMPDRPDRIGPKG